MVDEQNTTAVDVGDTDEMPVIIAAETRVEVLPLEPPEARVEVLPLEPPQEVRIGGQPGVRVQQSGPTQRKRVTGGDAPVGDNRIVPCGVLAEVRLLLDEQSSPLTAAERVRAARDLLAPWL